MHSTTKLRPQERGNVLFLILIGVALFAALCYAVTSSTGNSRGSISKETAKTNAATLIQFTTLLRQTVTRLKMNGCSDSQLDFSGIGFTSNNGVVTNSANTNAPADFHCHVFQPSGGALSSTRLIQSAFDLKHPQQANPSGNPYSQKAGAMSFRVMQVLGVGSDGAAGLETANDITGSFSYVNRETCIAINNAFGVNNPGGDPPEGVLTGTIGQFANDSLVSDAIRSISGETGLYDYCMHSGVSPNDVYSYQSVVVPR